MLKACSRKTSSLLIGVILYHHKWIESNYMVNQKFNNPKLFIIWHDRLGHSGLTMMRRIIENSYGHPLKNQKILSYNDCPCDACSQGNFVIRPSPVKVVGESPMFYESPKRYMWTYSPIMWTFSLFYGINRCII